MNVEATIASYGLATEFPIKALRQAEISVDADKALLEDASKTRFAENGRITVDPMNAQGTVTPLVRGSLKMAALSSGFTADVAPLRK